jgi:hypothetical protein
MNFIKKLKLFRTFKKALKDKTLTIELENKFNMRVDKAFRMYTVLNIPEELIGEAYSLRKADIDKISENFVREYTAELSNTLNSKGINELYEIYEMKKVDKYSWLIVVGFSLFKSNKYYNTLYYGVIPAVAILAIISLILFL